MNQKKALIVEALKSTIRGILNDDTLEFAWKFYDAIEVKNYTCVTRFDVQDLHDTLNASFVVYENSGIHLMPRGLTEVKDFE
jgi:hypothetical protein